MRNRIHWPTCLAVLLAVLCSALGCGGCQVIGMPGRSHAGPLPPLQDSEAELARRLRQHVVALADDIGERNVWRPEALARTADYIQQDFEAHGYSVARQGYRVDDVEVHNLEVTVEGTARADDILVVGAHYDTVSGCPGANDNTSGCRALGAAVAGAGGPADRRRARGDAWVPPARRPVHVVDGVPGAGGLCRALDSGLDASFALDAAGHDAISADTAAPDTGLDAQPTDLGAADLVTAGDGLVLYSCAHDAHPWQSI